MKKLTLLQERRMRVPDQKMETLPWPSVARFVKAFERLKHAERDWIMRDIKAKRLRAARANSRATARANKAAFRKRPSR